MFKKFSLASLSCLLLLTMGGCDKNLHSNDDPIISKDRHHKEGNGKFFGEDSFLFSSESMKSGPAEVGIGVNSYLWRASLDTMAFMPLKSVDPFGGVIITDWYSPKNAHNERLKVDIIILDRNLRADGLRVSVFRQIHTNGQWKDSAVDPQTARDLEDAILTRARQLKIDAGK